MTFNLHKLQSIIKKPKRKRLGRGNASGQGTYAGKGLKGQKARSGGSVRAGFEGGRSSLIVQTPKMRGKGFRSIYPKPISVSVSSLNKFKDGDKVTYKSLRALNIFAGSSVKIVGGGKLERKLSIVVPVSAGAKKAIESAGGTVVERVKAKLQGGKQETKK